MPLSANNLRFPRIIVLWLYMASTPLPGIAEKLFTFKECSDEEKEKILFAFYRKSRSRKIMCWLDPKTCMVIKKWWFPYAKERKIASNAIYFLKDYKRSYPFGSLLGQVLHTVQDEKHPFTRECFPTGGLELYFNDCLKGKLGRRLILRSARRPLTIGKIIRLPKSLMCPFRVVPSTMF